MIIHTCKKIISSYEQMVWEEPRFNVLTTLCKIDDEEKLHSKLICELLNGQNKISQLLMGKFLNILGVEDDPALFQVFREYKKIDILLVSEKNVIVIENKIFAKDQPKQIYRYYQSMLKEHPNKNILLCYLTLRGHSPSKDSLFNLKESDVKLISYDYDIDKWLEESLNLVASYPSYYETLKQYQELLNKLLGKGDNIMMKDIISEVSKSYEDIKAAKAISEAYFAIKPQIQYNFWRTLENEMSREKYDFENKWKYSEERVRKFYLGSKNNRNYGLLTKILEIDNEFSLALYIEVNHNVYWGYTIIDSNYERGYDLREEFKIYVEIFDTVFSETYGKYDTYDNYDWFIAGFEFRDYQLNFNLFNSDEIHHMLEQKYLDDYVRKLAEDINETTRLFLEGIKK